MNLSAHTLEVFLDKMPMGVAVFNLDFTLRKCNAVWKGYLQKVTGRPEQDIVPGLLLDRLLPENCLDLRPYLEEAFTGKSITKENLPLNTSEVTVYWNVFFSSLREGERITGALLIATDVTRGQRAVIAARTAEQALLTLMDSLPGMAYRGPLNCDREMELVNKGAQELTGYAPEQFIKTAVIPFGSLIHEDDKETVWEDLSQAVEGKRPFELLYRIRTADGQIKWVLEQGSGLFDPEGDLIAVEGFISDITERMLAHQILEKRVIDRTQKLSALYKMTTAAAEQGDLKTSLQSALSWILTAVHGQAAFVQLLDTTQAWLHMAVHSGLPAALAVDIERVSTSGGIWQRVLAAQKPFVLSDFNISEFPGADFFTDFHAYAGVPMMARGHLLGVMNIWRTTPQPFSESDVVLMVTAAEQMGTTIENARLRRDNDRLLLLDERNRLARELHDAVTQSLYSLTLFAEANQRFAHAGDFENVQQYSKRLAETAELSLKEMRLLLHNLRPSILQNSGLAEALQQRLDAVEKRAGVQALLRFGDGVLIPPHVEETLFHIAEEALNNSLKHAKATKVEVTVAQVHTLVTMTIQDNGCGFDMNNLSDVGGMGLASMHERAALLEGSIDITSQPGETVVVLTIDLDLIKDTIASQNLLDRLQD